MITKIFMLLANENRLRIFNLLHNSKLSVCEIEYLLNLSQSMVWRHLSMFQDAGIVEMQKELSKEYCYISKDFIQENARLYDYLINILTTESKLEDEVKKLEKYKKADLVLKL
jgi:ArsR family transcriptional regulator, arsenate/arsenite/antimonite-responsive transcriptional repressor